MSEYSKIYLIILSLFLFATLSCHDKENLLKPDSAYQLRLREPSGLTCSLTGNDLWTVSDEDNEVYRISLNGLIIDTIPVNAADLEGITMIDDSTLAVIAERTREVLVISLDGRELKRMKIDLPGEPNSGLEGIAFDRTGKHFYILNEKQPCLLMKFDLNFSLIEKKELTFSSDVSGIIFNSSENSLWILSDENRLIAKCDTSGNVTETLRLNIIQPEGIALDSENLLLYIVSDKTEKLYTYHLSN